LVLSAAHFARILQKEHQHTPLVRFAAVNHASIVTALNSPIKTPHDLRGQVIAVPDKLSLSTIVVLSSLREIGLKPGTDFRLLEVPSFASAIMSVQKGDAMAAVSSPGILTQMPKELTASVRTIMDTGEYLRIIFLTHPRIEKKYAMLIKQALLKFGNETNEGKQFLISTSSGAIVPVSTKDMDSLDRFAAETKRLLVDETN
jgi:phosphonate transport system substrate-binding protein